MELPDWVYEEEFSLVRAFQWNSSSDINLPLSDLMKQRFQNFQWISTQKDLYPSRQTFKYPKAGEKQFKSQSSLI